MKNFVLAFAGSIASGKSTISLNIAEALHWPYTSFSNYIRNIAKLRGLEETREVLQDIGQSLIEEGWEPFCYSVLNETNWCPGAPLVIDGIRHIEAVNTLRLIVSPTKLLLIFVNTQESIREARLFKRDTENTNMQIIENHPTEAQVKTLLPQIADLIVSNDKTTNSTLQEILAWLERIETIC